MSTPSETIKREQQNKDNINHTDGWMGGGMWLWPEIGIILVVLLRDVAKLIHRLTYRRTNRDNIHVRGDKEEGMITTPFG